MPESSSPAIDEPTNEGDVDTPNSPSPTIGVIDPSLIEPAATEVVEQLQEHGFEAYLVGGCVRDLMLGLTPKDFDVATNATPEEVRGVFRRSRMIGRRFRIVHVRVGRQLFEVSTYRKHIDEDDLVDESISTSEDGVILRDNSYGTQEDDTFRRDFTVNAMYFNPINGELLDLAGGQSDLAEGRLRLIGKPAVRFREDPVRILRAVRFAAKLGFGMDPDVEDAIPPTAELLTAIPPARLFDEMNKLFLAGTAEQAWDLLCHFELSPILFPASDPHDPLVRLAMASTDARIAEGKPVTPGFLFAVLLWDDYQTRITENALQQSMQEAENNAAIDCIKEQQLTIAIPRRFAQFIRDVWQLQPRLERRQKKNLSRMLSHPKFRAAYDFLLLRSELQLVEPEIAEWWTEIQKTNPVTPRQDDDDLYDDNETEDRGDREDREDRGDRGGNDTEGEAKPKRRRRRRRPRRRSGNSEGGGNSDNNGNSGNTGNSGNSGNSGNGGNSGNSGRSNNSGGGRRRSGNRSGKSNPAS